MCQSLKKKKKPVKNMYCNNLLMTSAILLYSTSNSFKKSELCLWSHSNGCEGFTEASESAYVCYGQKIQGHFQRLESEPCFNLFWNSTRCFLDLCILWWIYHKPKALFMASCLRLKCTSDCYILLLCQIERFVDVKKC